MSEPLPVADQLERERALDPAGSFIVQAPAGSGKTELLIQRFLVLLARVAEPEEIIAITFTRKAAGEMRGRIVAALAAADGPEPEPAHERLTWQLACAVEARDIERGWGLAASPSRLRIQTIDSLCAGLTRQMPLLSRFGAQPEVVEDATGLYREAARRTLEQVEDAGAGETLGTLLRHLDNDFGKVAALLVGMLPRRDQWLRHILGASASERRAELERALANLIRDRLEDTRSLVPPALAESWLELGGFAAAKLAAGGKDSPILACAGLDRLPGTEPEALGAWRGLAELALTREGTWRKTVSATLGFPAPSAEREGLRKAALQRRKDQHRALMEELAAHETLRAALHELRELPPAHYEDSQVEVLDALSQVLRLAAVQLFLVFQERGEVDFTAVARAAVQALGDEETPTDLALALDYRIQHVLVDEFQDTSLGQYELLGRLTAGWQKGDGRTLFAVGDPMQSIYRFREAEVGLYLQARRHGIGTVRLEPLTLAVNFRSQGGIVEWVNRAFAAVFPAREDPGVGAVTYAQSVAHRAALPNDAVTVHPFSGRADAAEAERVLELLRAEREERPDARVAVLVRSRAHLLELVPRLRDAGIRFRAIEIDSLAERTVVQDLLALTRALSHAGDRLAWLAVLRAPWCGLELGDLFALAGEDHACTVPSLLERADRLDRLSPAGRQRLERVRPILLAALGERGRSGLRERVAGTWLALGGPACLGEASDLEAAEVYLALLESLAGEGELSDLAALEEAVAALYAPPDPGADERLQIMTIHKAKGLEFDTVIVPGLGRRPRADAKRLLLWLERPRPDGTTDLLLAPVAEAGAEDDPIYKAIGRIERHKAQNEDARLLYVASTRARERLHLLGHALRDEKRGLKPDAASLLAALWPAVEGDFARAAGGEELEPGEGERGEETGIEVLVPAIRRLPTSWEPPAPPPDLLWRPGPGLEEESETLPVEFSWAGETARHVGTLVHGMLQRIAQEGLGGWDRARVEGLGARLATALTALGVPAAELSEAVGRVQEALTRTLECPRGRWILADHREGRCEYPISGLHRGEILSAVIDRTFVDAQGMRWIIDYKTGTHTGGGVEEFLDREQERYREQLERYAALLAALEPGPPVRVGLYYPLLGGWREWEVRV